MRWTSAKHYFQHPWHPLYHKVAPGKAQVGHTGTFSMLFRVVQGLYSAIFSFLVIFSDLGKKWPNIAGVFWNVNRVFSSVHLKNSFVWGCWAIVGWYVIYITQFSLVQVNIGKSKQALAILASILFQNCYYFTSTYRHFQGALRTVVPKLGVNYSPGVICRSSGGNAEPKPQCCSVLWAITGKEIVDMRCEKFLLRKWVWIRLWILKLENFFTRSIPGSWIGLPNSQTFPTGVFFGNCPQKFRTFTGHLWKVAKAQKFAPPSSEARESARVGLTLVADQTSACRFAYTLSSCNPQCFKFS